MSNYGRMADENENLKLEFLLWHIDDEPSIADC